MVTVIEKIQNLLPVTLEMTRRYANLVTADLQAIHERVRLLSK
jgi:hypothetical protein